MQIKLAIILLFKLNLLGIFSPRQTKNSCCWNVAELHLWMSTNPFWEPQYINQEPQTQNYTLKASSSVMNETPTDNFTDKHGAVLQGC